PASAPSDRLRRSPLRALSWPHCARIRRASSILPAAVSRLRPGTVRHDPGLAASPWVWHTVEVERGGGRAPRWRLASTIADQGLSPSRNLATPSSRIGGSTVLSAANIHVIARARALASSGSKPAYRSAS